MSNNWLKYLVGISAILIAGTAAYFSVTGLGVLFSGAAIAVMVMASSLEFAKLVTATYLKQKWEDLKGFNKWYLSFAVAVLMLITSAGIFGYLSNAFQQQNLKLDQVQREISVWENKIKGNNDQIATLTTQLNGLQSNQGTILEKGKVNSRLLRSVDNRDKQVNKLTDKINILQDSVISYNGKINEIKNNNISIEREVGGFRFVADAFGVELNSVVKFFIILIVIVFDPLAIALVIALNQLIMVKRKEEDVISKPEELKDFVDETTRVHLSESDLKKLEEVLLNPPLPNEKLKEASKRYSDEVREKHTHIDDFEVNEEKPWDGISQEVWDRMKKIEEYRESIHGPILPEDEPTGALANSEHRGKLLAEIMQRDEELGLYNEPFDNPMIKESENSELYERLTKMDEELKLQEEEYDDDDISDWDATLMDGLEDEEPFFTEEELEKILQEEPTEEEIQRNFSTIEPISENIFQDEDYLTDAILEFNRESIEEEFGEFVPEPLQTTEESQTFGLDIKQLNETLEEVNKEIDTEIEETSPIESDEKKKY
jgi:hypothetical protein